MQNKTLNLLSIRHIADADAELPPSVSVPGSELAAADLPSSADTPLKITLVSNSQLLREGLFTLLSNYLVLELAGSFSFSRAFSEPFPQSNNHVVLVDGTIDFATLHAWISYCRRFTPPILTIVVELAHDSDLVLACIEAGANGYVLQGASSTEVAQTIDLTRRGLASCSPDITARLFERLSKQGKCAAPEVLPGHLTPRELEVLQCIAAGLSNQDIASHLVIGVRTVKHHVHNILDKLKLSGRREAASFGVEQGWIGRDLPRPVQE